MNKKITIDNIKSSLLSYDCIEFAFVFGSLILGKSNSFSDVDVAIYLNRKIDLPETGRIINELEKITGKKIDLVELNNLFSINPVLTFEIITKSELLFSKNEKSLTEFKTRTYLNYFDTEKLRINVNKDFYRRISNKKFGNRNYAG
jgi:predicted nucleotidyltransferase